MNLPRRVKPCFKCGKDATHINREKRRIFFSCVPHTPTYWKVRDTTKKKPYIMHLEPLKAR